jgi:hypothetical protein
VADNRAALDAGRLLRVECKKGPLSQSRSLVEYPLIREALGQLLTIDEVSESDVLAVAVPFSPRFERLAERWRAAPLIARFGLPIATVDREGNVTGLEAAFSA